MASELKRPKRLSAVLGLLLAILIPVVFTASAGAVGLSEKKSQAAAMTTEIAALRARAAAANTSWLTAQRKLEAIRVAVRKSTKELAQAKTRLKHARATASARASAMYKQRGVTLVDVLMQSASFGEMVQQIRLFARLADYDRDVMTALRETQSEVAAKHDQLVAAREAARLIARQRQQESAHSQLALSTRQSTLAGLQSEIQELQATLRQPSPAPSATQSAEPAAETSPTTTSAAPSGGWWPQIQAAAAANGISAQGLYKLMMIESGGIQTIVGGGQFCGLYQYWSGTWKASWNPYRASSIFDGAAQIKATALAIGMGKGPYWWPGSYQHAFGGT